MLHFITPEEFKKHPSKVYYDIWDSPFGPAIVGMLPLGVCWLSFGDMNHQYKQFTKLYKLNRKKNLKEELYQLMVDPRAVPLILLGTAFQHTVWKALSTIPAGTTITYKNLAGQIEHPTAVRAVAGAVGANPISYLIPCHRVIHQQAKHSGYRWGPEIKERILKTEQESKG